MSPCAARLLCLVWCALALLSVVTADTCITCRRDTLEDCTNGTRAREFDDQRQKCSDSLPFCEVTVQERLDATGGEPQLRDVTRGCIAESRFTCTTESSVRTCTATCQGELCNDFQDVALRVQQHQEAEERRMREEEERRMREEEERRMREEEERRMRQKEEDAARLKWVVPVAVLVPLALLVVVAVGIVLTRRNRAG